MTTPKFKIGQRVKLLEVTPEMAERGLKIGMTGVVREVLNSTNQGVEFIGFSDTGWNAGLHVTSIGYHRVDGSYVLAVDLCEALTSEV